ncbi:MAG: DUF4870 domain-containing protein [Anaerolineaceae bacterium]
MSQYDSTEITNDDKIWSALGYPIPLIPIFMLLIEEKRNRPFIRFHAVQSLAVNVVLYVIVLVISFLTLGFGAVCAPIAWLITLWPAYEAYQSKWVELPFITNFIKKQNWV